MSQDPKRSVGSLLKDGDYEESGAKRARVGDESDVVSVDAHEESDTRSVSACEVNTGRTRVDLLPIDAHDVLSKRQWGSVTYFSEYSVDDIESWILDPASAPFTISVRKTAYGEGKKNGLDVNLVAKGEGKDAKTMTFVSPPVPAYLSVGPLGNIETVMAKHQPLEPAHVREIRHTVRMVDRIGSREYRDLSDPEARVPAIVVGPDGREHDRNFFMLYQWLDAMSRLTAAMILVECGPGGPHENFIVEGVLPNEVPAAGAGPKGKSRAKTATRPYLSLNADEKAEAIDALRAHLQGRQKVDSARNTWPITYGFAFEDLREPKGLGIDPKNPKNPMVCGDDIGSILVMNTAFFDVRSAEAGRAPIHNKVPVEFIPESVNPELLLSKNYNAIHVYRMGFDFVTGKMTTQEIPVGERSALGPHRVYLFFSLNCTVGIRDTCRLGFTMRFASPYHSLIVGDEMHMGGGFHLPLPLLDTLIPN